jgi:predicted membrane-bound spermidine synthase
MRDTMNKARKLKSSLPLAGVMVLLALSLPAEHTMEARTAGGAVIDTTTIDVTQLTDYTYALDRPDINVVNSWGETLKIYMDGVYQFTIVDDENRWLIGVSLVSHFLKATRASDDSEVASITINVTQNKDYSWTIQ